MEHFLIIMMRVQYKGLYSSQSCYLEGTHLMFYALKGPKKCQMNHDNSFDQNIPGANSKKIIQSKRFFLLL